MKVKDFIKLIEPYQNFDIEISVEATDICSPYGFSYVKVDDIKIIDIGYSDNKLLIGGDEK